MKLKVRTTSSNLWWGIFGLSTKAGWEDLRIFDEAGKKVGVVCLNTKHYLRQGIEELKAFPEDAEFVKAVERYLGDDQIHYWYFYDKKGNEDFHEVSYDAPLNEEGVKPSSVEIWHPDENIRLSTIQSAIKAFANQFLEIANWEVQLEMMDFEEALKSFFEENERIKKITKVEFSPKLIAELSTLWELPEASVLAKLKKYL